MTVDTQDSPHLDAEVAPRELQSSVLRARILGELQDAGFVYRERDGLLELPDDDGDPKAAARKLHAAHRRAVLAKNAKFVDRWEDRLLTEFASGDEVDPERIAPKIVPVVSKYEGSLFRFASLRWSVPVSVGYGRRTRFLVFDEHNGKLVGIFALGDPVFNLAVRDRLIGWTGADRAQRLYNVFDAFVLGAVEPYNYLLGGKLIAACAVADQTAAALVAKYTGTQTVIKEAVKDPTPVLVTTTSSLGRSSIYNRVTFDGRRLFASIGYTEGFGHFHFGDELFEHIVQYLQLGDVDARRHAYGNGPNWRIRTLRQGLEALGLKGDLLRHGIRREVFIAPRAMGWRSYLRGETDFLRWFDLDLGNLADHWRERWGSPRAARDDRYLGHKRDSMRISGEIADLSRAQ
jgi:hypothetical protein